MIDTHCHIDDLQYQPLEQYLLTQQEGGVEAIIVPATDAASSKQVLTLCNTLNSQLSTTLHSKLSTLNYLSPAIGLHPEEVTPHWSSQLDEIESLLSTLNYSPQGATSRLLSTLNSPLSTIRAIGEIGLDYHFSTDYKTEQQAAFRRQLCWAKQYHLPVIIHSRDATEDCLRLLREEDIHCGVMHCFSGSHETAQQIVQMGFYLGVGGVITFKNCKLKEALKGIDLERLVLETDGPYMAPVPHRGERNESRWMRYVMDVLAQVYDCSVEHIDEVTTANAKALFDLK